MESENQLTIANYHKRVIGDLVNGLIIVNTYIYVIVAHANGLHIELSPYLAQDGFCVSNKEGFVLWQSHVLYFYEDTSFALLIWFLVKIGKGMLAEGDVTLMTGSTFSTFVHGAAHFSIAYRDYTAYPDGQFPENTIKPLRVITILVFWPTFMWVVHPDHTISKEFLRAAFWTIVHLLMPRLYAFTFVHCVLVMEFSIKVMQVKEVGPFYNVRHPPPY